MSTQILYPYDGYDSLIGCSGTTGAMYDGIPVFVPNDSAWATVDDFTLNTTDSIIGGYLGYRTVASSGIYYGTLTNSAYCSNYYDSSPGSYDSDVYDTYGTDYLVVGEYDDLRPELSPIIRYTLNVQHGATIASAILRLIRGINGGSGREATADIFAVKEDNPSWPTVVESQGYIQGITSPTTSIILPSTGLIGDIYDIDITDIIQNIIDRSGWTAGNSILIIIAARNGSGVVWIDDEPILTVTLDTDAVYYNTMTASNNGGMALVYLDTHPLGIIPQSGYVSFNAETYVDSKTAYLKGVGVQYNLPNGVNAGGTHLFSIPSGLTSSATTHNIPFNTLNYNSNSYGNPVLLQLMFGGSGVNGKIDDYRNISFKVNSLNATLFGNPPDNGACELYMRAPEPYSGDNTLYTSGPIPYSGDYNPTLYTSGPIPYSGDYNPTLFLDCDPPSGDVPLYISHAETIETGLPLFIEGHGVDYSGLDLFIYGGINKSFDLYIKSDPEAYSISSSGTTLVIWPLGAGGSGTSTGSTTIYTLNYNNESGECPLYISVIESGTFEYNTPLFLQSTRFYPNNNNIPLTIWTDGAGGSGYPSYESSLYVCHADISDGYVPLYIPVVASGERDDSFPIHLYNLGDVYSFSPPDLVIWNKTSSGDSNTTLYTTAFWDDSSNFPLEIIGPLSGGFIDSVPFFSKSVDPIAFADNRKVVPLVILNKLKHGSGIVELSIGNGFPISGNPTLFVEGGGIVDNIDNIDLYINSRISYSGNMPLVTTAGLNNSYHDLYVQAKELTFSSGNSTLFIYSADGSGIYNAKDLFMSCDAYGSRTPLFIATHEYGTPNSGFPLYMGNEQNSTLGMDIYLQSLQSSSNSIKFHTGGDGFIDGASVQRGEIPLYIARPNNADGYSTLLHINGPSGETSGLEMSIMGGTYSIGDVTLAIPTVLGTNNSNMEIFTHGF